MSDLAILSAPVELPAPACAAALANRAAGAGASAARPQADVAKVAKDFESVLLHKLMETMQATVPESSLLGGETTQQVQGIFWYYMAQEVSSHGGVGLWKDIYSRLGGAEAVPVPAVEQKL